MFFKILDVASSSVTYTLSGLLFAAVACFLLKTLLEESFKLYKLWRATKKFPGPTGLPILGTLLDIVRSRENVIELFVHWTETYPSPCYGWFGPKLHFAVCDPDNIKAVLQSQKALEKPYIYEFGGKYFGNGLLTSKAKVWRVHRKLVTTFFNHRVLPPYTAFLAENAQELVKEMEVALHGKEFQIDHYTTPCILRMLFGVILGTAVKLDAEELQNFHDDLKRYTALAFNRVLRIWLYPDVIYNRTTVGQEFNKLIDRLAATVEKALEQVDAEESDDTANDRAAGNESIPGLFMNLPRGKDDFTRQDFIDQLHTMLAAGAHTVTLLMDSLLRMLAYHPHIQDKVYEELYSIYGSTNPTDRPIRTEDLPRMEYLECTINESLRLFPSGGFIARTLSDDLDTGSFVLPGGCTIVINILGLHRDGKSWPDPLKFDPDRFLPENVAKRVPGAFIPFSSGPRNCIGGKYSIMVAKILTASILRRYILRSDKIVPIKDIRLKGNFVLECAEPWHLRIEERNSGKK